MWRFIHKWGSPKWFYTTTGPWLPWLWSAALLLLMVGVVWGLAIAPPDRYQHDSARILYVHVPAAILAQSCFAVMAVAAIIFLVWKIKIADIAAMVMAPFGAAMTFAALFSGAVWGIPTWGTWWVWDARLTSMLIQLFIYLGVIGLRASFTSRDSGARAAAIMTLVGVVNLPIIKYSVVWWNTLHQPATFSLDKAPAMPASMWLPLLFSVLGFYLFFAAHTLTRTRNQLLKREARSRWVKEIALGTGKAS